MRVFVIWDLVAPAVRTLVEALPELWPRMPKSPQAKGDDERLDEAIEWLIPGVTATGKEMARDVIASGVRSAEHVIALLDRPSMSVGWQVGLSLGWRKSLQLSSIGSALPSWTQVGALKGLFTHHLNDVTGMAQLLTPLQWQLPEIPALEPTIEVAPSLVLCPGGPIGSTLREVALRERGLRALPEEGWGLYELPRLLSGLSRVVWVMASDGKGQAQELADNASNGVIAGFAEASGLAVSVLRAEEIAPVVDVQPREHRFRSLAEFKQKLQTLCTPAATKDPLPSSVSSSVPAALSPEHSPEQRRWALLALLLLVSVAAVGMAFVTRDRAVWQRGAGSAANVSPKTALASASSATPSTVPPPAEVQPPAAVPDLGAGAATAKTPAPVKGKSAARSRKGAPDAPDPYALMANMMQLATAPMSLDPNLRSATAPANPAPAPEPSPPRPRRAAGGCEMDDAELKQLLTDAKREALQQQWAVLAEGTQARCLTMKQLRSVLKGYYLGSDRVRIMRWIGPRVLDPRKAYQLEDMLTYRDEISTCKELFGCCQSACVDFSQQP